MVHDTDAVGTLTTAFTRPGQYPGLRKEESDLLRAYLRDRGTDDIRRLRTAVSIGPGEDVPSLQEPYREMAFEISRWKADAVIDDPGRTTIIELKSRSTHTSVGQVRGYRHYLRQLDHEHSEPRLLVVAWREHPAVREFAMAEDVEVHTVPHADPTTASRPFRLADSLEDLRS